MTRIVTRDGVAFDVHDRGRGPTLVLLHGFAVGSRTWDGVIERMGTGRRVLAIDLLGHGGSDGPPAPRHRIESQAGDIGWLIDGLVGRRVDVLGYSFGARVALWLTVLVPGLIQRLVLESPSAGILDPGMRAARSAADERWAAMLEQGDMEAFHDAWEAQPLFASRAHLDAGTRAAILEGHLAGDGRGLAASLRGAGQGVMPPLHDRLGAVRQPALVLAGSLDPVGRERATEVAHLLPAARLEIIDEAGHAPHLERPEAFLPVVLDFLESPIRGEP